jgi:predicted molibdopterin-dependent oxidoreductase YjgC
MTNSIREIRDADCVLVTGSNTTEAHPVISYEIIRAVKRGANLIVIEPRRIPLVEHATLFLQVKPGTDIYVFLAMMHLIIREGWADLKFIEARTEGYQAFADIVEEYTPERASLMSGVAVDLIEKAARVYALGERDSGDSIFPDERGHSSILYAMGITQRSSGTDIVMTLANLSLLGGQVGKPSTGVNPLRGQSNVQGACDIGCLVNYLPGYQLVTDEVKRKTVAKSWGVADLPGKVGLTIMEAMHAISDGKMHAMYVMGENPMLSDPNTTHAEASLRKLDFLVVQDIFPNETAQLAHVILPAAAALEKTGTFTNTERRVQVLHPVVQSPGQARPDWQIISEIAARFEREMGTAQNIHWDFTSPEAVMKEITSVTPQYAGISYPRLEGKGLQWPCPTPEHPGTRLLHANGFSRGLGKFNPIHAHDAAEQTDEEYPLILTTGRSLYHYHTGTMTRRSQPLSWREAGRYVEINAADASAFNLEENQMVVLKSRRGEVMVKARIGQRVPPGTVFLAFHWREAPANMLTQDFALDPVAKIPEYKVCAVRLEHPQ